MKMSKKCFIDAMFIAGDSMREMNSSCAIVKLLSPECGEINVISEIAEEMFMHHVYCIYEKVSDLIEYDDPMADIVVRAHVSFISREDPFAIFTKEELGNIRSEYPDLVSDIEVAEDDEAFYNIIAAIENCEYEEA